MSQAYCHVDPTTANDATAQATVGALYKYMHPSYGEWVLRYTKFVDAVTYAAGQSCTEAAVNGASVTNDRSGGSSLGTYAKGGGLALLAMTQNYYGYALVEGYYPTIKTSGADDIAVGESLILHGSTDGTCDGVAAGSTTTASFGTASIVDVDADNTVAGYVNFR